MQYYTQNVSGLAPKSAAPGKIHITTCSRCSSTSFGIIVLLALSSSPCSCFHVTSLGDFQKGTAVLQNFDMAALASNFFSPSTYASQIKEGPGQELRLGVQYSDGRHGRPPEVNASSDFSKTFLKSVGFGSSMPKQTRCDGTNGCGQLYARSKSSLVSIILPLVLPKANLTSCTSSGACRSPSTTFYLQDPSEIPGEPTFKKPTTFWSTQNDLPPTEPPTLLSTSTIRRGTWDGPICSDEERGLFMQVYQCDCKNITQRCVTKKCPRLIGHDTLLGEWCPRCALSWCQYVMEKSPGSLCSRHGLFKPCVHPPNCQKNEMSEIERCPGSFPDSDQKNHLKTSSSSTYSTNCSTNATQGGNSSEGNGLGETSFETGKLRKTSPASYQTQVQGEIC